jgi:C_GCAxxG_C_C family probable redox protein
MNLKDTAEKRFREGYSCSQAVFSTLAERWNVPPELSLRIAAGFGGGMGRTAGKCGCVTGAIMAIGLTQASVSQDRNREEKEKTYETCRRFLRAFEERNGSILCVELLGCNISTPEGLEQARRERLFQLKCPMLVRDAIEIFESMFSGRIGS